jgi:hypothetical protein
MRKPPSCYADLSTWKRVDRMNPHECDFEVSSSRSMVY